MSKPKSASAQKAKPTLKLATVVSLRQPEPVGDIYSLACVDTLRHLLRQAERGELIGCALVTMYKKNEYQVGVIGMLDRNATFALGTVEVLKAKLLEKAGA